MAIIAKYSLNGNANALVGSNGTANNVTWVDGKSNGAGSFNGSSSRINIDNFSGTLLDTSFTMEMLFFIPTTTSSTENSFLFGHGLRDMGIRWGNVSGNIQFQLWDGSTTPYLNTPINKNEWVYAVFVRDKSSGMKVYINGVEKASNSFTGNALTLSEQTRIGCRHQSPNNVGFFTGLIDEVIMHNTALTPAEIKNKALFYNGFI